MRLVEFILAATIAEITPGPNMGYLASLAMAKGRQAGLAAVAGVTLGLSILGVAAAFGYGALVDFFPPARAILRWAGVAYLLWLAIDTWQGGEGDGAGNVGESFQRGLIVNLLNPKAAVFYVAVLPLFLGSAATMAGTLILTAVYVAIATSVHAGVVIGAASFRSFAESERRLTLFQRAAAVLLALIALWFAWDTR
jgi:threonine/homoserine/homoserine lactone efflux protein